METVSIDVALRVYVAVRDSLPPSHTDDAELRWAIEQSFIHAHPGLRRHDPQWETEDDPFEF